MVRFPALLLACALSPQDPPPEAAVAWWQERLAALARTDGRHGTFGPVGDRLWVTRIEPRPGLQGVAHYVHHSSGLDDPLRVDVLDAERRPLGLEVVARQWQPTHGVVEYAIEGGGHLREERWLTRDDVFVDRFTVRGRRELAVRWHSPLAERPDGSLERFTPVPLHRHADVDLMRDPRLRTGPPAAPVWMEGEDPERQQGSTGTDRKRSASGWEVLGRGFGSDEEDRAAWSFLGGGGDVPRTLLVRYARDAAEPARWQVLVRGMPVGTITCPPTGGWGQWPDQLDWARLDLGPLPQGLVEVELRATADGSNTNIDGLMVLPTARADDPPPPERWPALDPLRGALSLARSHAFVHGAFFRLVPPNRPQAVGPGTTVEVGGEGTRLHLLAVPTGPEGAVEVGGRRVVLPPRGRGLERHYLAIDVAGGAVAVTPRSAVLLAATREAPRAGPRLRRGRGEWNGVPTEIVAGLHGLDDPLAVRVPEGEEVTFHVTLEFAGGRRPGVATARALAAGDTLARHRWREAAWYAARAPRLTVDDPLLQRLWTYRWFLVRHNLARPRAGHLPGPVVYEGRHGSWYPRVITFSLPHIVAETRWLGDQELTTGNLRAHLAHQQDDGVLPNLLAGWQGFRYVHWGAEAAVGAAMVHGDRAMLAGLVPGLRRMLEGWLARFDGDGDGALDPGDHYTTGMEFQPSFWFHRGYDNSEPQTDLERPDFTAYAYGNATALARACRWLGDEEGAAAMDALAARLREGALDVLWHGEDRFFYSVRAADDDPARCKEVIGFYPFRFRLPPAQAEYLAALAPLVDEAEFWTPFPVASCSREVPVFSPHVQDWPGPGGVVQPCMWNGQTWPHANSLAADTMATALRHYPGAPLEPEHLAAFLRRYARLHCEDGDPGKLLLREYADGETGAMWGCPDYMHSTFNDLIVRHVAGLVPRMDDTLEVRPLVVLGDLELADIPYHGRRVGIAIRGNRLVVRLGGEVVGEGRVDDGLFLGGVLSR